MKKPPYSERSQRSQIALLHGHARSFLARWGWPEDAQVTCINHAFNTTFRVRAKGRPEAALRINVNSSKGLDEVRAETAFVSHLRQQGLLVPQPLSSPEGECVLESVWEGSRPLKAVLYTWLKGRRYDSLFTIKDGFELGRLTQRLHAAAAHWTPPHEGSVRPAGDPLGGLPWVMDDQKGLGLDLGVWKEVLARTASLYEQMAARPRIVIHDDLHMWNLMKLKEGMAVFDFDDMVMGWPIRDAAVTLFYVRRLKDAEAAEAAYWTGLGLTWEEAGLTKAQFELMVGARILLLANDLAQNATAELRAELPGYAGKADKRLRRMLEDGVYLPLDTD